MEITFRPARADDADAMVPLVHASGPSAFDYVLTAPRREMTTEKFLRKTLAQPAGEFGFGVHWVGESGGEIVAAGAAFDAQMLANSVLIAMRQVVSAYGIPTALGVIRRGLAVGHLLPPPKGKEWLISHLGVAPDLRGHGIGGQLVNTLVQRGRDRDCTHAVLDVSVENPMARALYERLGFRITGEVNKTMRNTHGHVPGFHRMALRL